MISLKEHIQITEALQLLEGESPQFTPDQLAAAEYYTLKWNAISGNTVLCLFDASGVGLGNVEFEDPDVAIAFVEEYFDIDDDEVDSLESYEWANDSNVDDRQQNALADDGTTVA